jgi:hypothetical protein
LDKALHTIQSKASRPFLLLCQAVALYYFHPVILWKILLTFLDLFTISQPIFNTWFNPINTFDIVLIIFLGYATLGKHYEIIRDIFPDLDVNCFIRKPIANKDLLKQVKEILKLT